MDCEVTLKKVLNADDPVKRFEQTFGDMSLKKWLKIGFGHALCKCLREATKEIKSIIRNGLKIVNAIIPPIPNFMDNELMKTSLKDCNDLIQVEKLVSMIIRPFVDVAQKYLDNEILVFKVLLKIIYYASLQTLHDCDNRNLSHVFLENSLDPYCSDSAHTAMALLIILGEKMPNSWFKNFLEPEVFLQMRMIVMRNERRNCPYVDYLRKLYYDLNLEEKFYLKFPTYKLLEDTCPLFNEEFLTTALRCVSQIINENEIHPQQFIQSGLLSKFHSVLCNPSEVGDQTFVIKSFLTALVCFETGSENNYTWRSNYFEKLVLLLVGTLDYVVSISCNVTSSYRKTNIYCPLSTVERFKNDAIVTVQILESLYVLNSTWHQWFDIIEDNNLIEGNLFESWCLYYRFAEDMEEHVNDEWLVNLIKMCPATVSAHQRHEIFKKLLPKRDYGTSFEITRINALRDISEIFRRFDHITSDQWDFTLKNEISSGPGVTREIYSILSQELQRHDIGLWQREPTRSDNEIISTYSPDGLFPNVSKGTTTFKLLGKIMAKAILDKQFLDIPISIEFFKRLRIIQLKNHSHLRRDYFDLLHAFPMLDSLFKQLLPVKRKVEAIRAEVGLSQRQKQEIISNLTFEDGSSFDDLCLNFTVPGTDIELIEGGSDVLLSPQNINLYLEKLCAHKLQLDPASQFEAIREGFDEVLPYGNIDLLLPVELKDLVCCDDFQRWTEVDLLSHCDYDDSRSVRYLFRCLASFDTKRQRLFLRFVTGRTSLPYGGLSRLNPPLTISKINRDHADSSLPSAATCTNLLYLPEYSSFRVARQKILHAIEEGSNSFSFA